MLLEDLTVAETRAILESEMAIDTFVEKVKKTLKMFWILTNLMYL